jgi:hypothetical protein
VLRAGQHIFYCGDGVGSSQISSTLSLFLLLQNDAGKSCFSLSSGTDAVALLLLFNVVQCQKKAAAHHVTREEGNSGRRFHCHQNDFMRWMEARFFAKI